MNRRSLPAGFAALTLASALAACGGTLDLRNMLLQGSGTSGKGQQSGEDDALPFAARDLRGSIVTASGSASSLAGWSLMLIDHDRGAARLAEIDESGRYIFTKVDKRGAKTFALLSPAMIVEAVLSVPADVPNAIRQFVRPQRDELPTLELRGPVVAFLDTDGLEIERDLASDSDGDGVPDGMDGVHGGGGSGGSGVVAGLMASESSHIDLDLDGTPNELDPDIDGDGVVNVIDADDNGNAIADVFDADANGNLVADFHEALSDHHFDAGWAVVTTATLPDATRLTPVFRLADGARPPLAVQVRGSMSLLAGATVQAEGGVQPWNRSLLDDGQSCDGVANDGLFAQCVTLAIGKAPRHHEVLSIDLVYGDPVAPMLQSLPHTFGARAAGTVTASFDATSRAVRVTAAPFGDTRDYIWAVSVVDEAGALTFTSAAVPGTTSSVTLPANVEGTAVEITAQTLAVVPGFPWMTTTSQRVPAEL